MGKRLTKRKEQAIATRNRILEESIKLFEINDIKNVSIEEIAERAEVSVGAIYHYFHSKEEIAAQSMKPLDETYHAFYEKLQSAEEYKSLNAMEKFKKYYVYIHEILCQHANLRNIYIYCLRNPGNDTLKIAQSRTLYQDYAAFLQESRKEEILKSAIEDEELVFLLTQASRGMIVDHLMFATSQEEIKQQAEKWFDLILHGLSEKGRENFTLRRHPMDHE